MKLRDFILLVSLAAVWGASFLFMRVATPVLGPVVTIEFRVVIATLALLLYAVAIKHRPAIVKMWKEFLIIGALNAAIPFVLICTAELHLTASLASILNATTPMFTALVAWMWVKEPLGLKKFTGLLIGIIGVIILVGWSPVPMDKKILLSVLFSLLAAVFYGVGGIYAARTFKGIKPLDMAIGQQLAASLLLLPFSVTNLPATIPSAAVVFSVLALAVLSTSLGYLLYFALINSVGAVKTLSVTFLVPLFGIIWGAIFLKETVFFNTFLGMIVIFISIVFVTSQKRVETDIRKEDVNYGPDKSYSGK